MSEVIERFIRTNSHLSQKEAFDGFLGQDRIKAWVGVDETRKARLWGEFVRVWSAAFGETPSAQAAALATPPATARPATTAAAAIAPTAAPAATPAFTKTKPRTKAQAKPAAKAAPAASAGLATDAPTLQPIVENAPAFAANDAPPRAEFAARKLDVLCTSCSRVNVWMRGNTVSCHSCGHEYGDLLQLIRVTPVGPFEFMFGSGWAGRGLALAICSSLTGAYFLFRGS